MTKINGDRGRQREAEINRGRRGRRRKGGREREEDRKRRITNRANRAAGQQ